MEQLLTKASPGFHPRSTKLDSKLLYFEHSPCVLITSDSGVPGEDLQIAKYN